MLFRMIALALMLTSCKGKGFDDSDVGTSGGSIEVYPPVGSQGTSMDVDLDASSSTFEYGNTDVDFGDGISVDEVYVEDGWSLVATITIEADATLGDRDVDVMVGSQDTTIADSFTIIDQSFIIEPDYGKIGETLEIDILGNNTEWVGGVTWPTFGDEVEIQDFSVLSETLATATVAITSDAAPGWRNVVMDNGGGDLVTLYDGFRIDRVAVAATFDPEEAEQGDTVEFTIVARDTNFNASDPELVFYDRYGENADIVVDDVTVLDAENLYGQMTLSNAANLGMRDVLVGTDSEAVLISDAFEVVEGDWALEEVAIDLSFVVVRSKDNSTGEISESVYAQCIFYIPLDPACPALGETDCYDGVDNDEDGYKDCWDTECMGYGYCDGDGCECADGSDDCDETEAACPAPDKFGDDPAPYDANGVIGVYSSGNFGNGEEDCPFPTTVPAGDYIWLESESNIITLDKTEDTSTGAVYYYASDLTIDDYVTDEWYDLHTQGEDDGIGEELLEAVQPTVPADWEWTSPDLWGNYTHNRAEAFEFEWTDAETYPDAMFIVYICTELEPCPMSEDGYYGYAGAYPWDDGEHEFTASEMSLMGDGSVPVYAYSIISGPEFGLPDSIYQENQAVSYIYLAQSMVLE